jgi:hypothetical protein
MLGHFAECPLVFNGTESLDGRRSKAESTGQAAVGIARGFLGAVVLQGDQIGRSFVCWAMIVYFGQVL